MNTNETVKQLRDAADDAAKQGLTADADVLRNQAGQILRNANHALLLRIASQG